MAYIDLVLEQVAASRRAEHVGLFNEEACAAAPTRRTAELDETDFNIWGGARDRCHLARFNWLAEEEEMEREAFKIYGR
jgi:hypothetical protein